MKKIECETCGGHEIKKIGDDLFECQNCGVRYSTNDVKKLIMKIDRTDEMENYIKRGEQFESIGEIEKSKEYYNKALDINADNTAAKNGLNRIDEQQSIKDVFIVEAQLDAEENIKNFLKQLAVAENVACDIYKTIKIDSVVKKYVPAIFVKHTCRCDWSATACNKYYENQTVIKERYDPDLKRRVKEPVTEQIEKVERTPVNGSDIRDHESFALVSNAVIKEFSVNNSLTEKLVKDFESLQLEKIAKYNIVPFNNNQVIEKDDDTNYFQNLLLDYKVDTDLCRSKMEGIYNRENIDDSDRIERSINADFVENFNGIRHIVSETIKLVFIPVQIINFSYKGESFCAVSDLISRTTSVPTIYPRDIELSENEKNVDKYKSKVANAGFDSWSIKMIALIAVASLIIMGCGSWTNDDSVVKIGVWGIGISIVIGMLIAIRKSVLKKKLEEKSKEFEKNYSNPRKQYILNCYNIFFDNYCTDLDFNKLQSNMPKNTTDINFKADIALHGKIREFTPTKCDSSVDINAESMNAYEDSTDKNDTGSNNDSEDGNGIPSTENLHISDPERVYLLARDVMEDDNIEAYEAALSDFETIPDYKNSSELADFCRKKIIELGGDTKEIPHGKNDLYNRKQSDGAINLSSSDLEMPNEPVSSVSPKKQKIYRIIAVVLIIAILATIIISVSSAISNTSVADSVSNNSPVTETTDSKHISNSDVFDDTKQHKTNWQPNFPGNLVGRKFLNDSAQELFVFESGSPYGELWRYFGDNYSKKGGKFNNWEITSDNYIKTWYNPDRGSSPVGNGVYNYYFVYKGYLIENLSSSNIKVTFNDDKTAIEYNSAMGTSNGSYKRYNLDGTANKRLEIDDDTIIVENGNYFFVNDRIIEIDWVSYLYMNGEYTEPDEWTEYIFIDDDCYFYPAYSEYGAKTTSNISTTTTTQEKSFDGKNSKNDELNAITTQKNSISDKNSKNDELNAITTQKNSISDKNSKTDKSSTLSTTALHTHQFSKATCIQPAQCYYCGYTDNKLGEHQFNGGNCKQPGKCLVCGCVSDTLGEHDFGGGTCQKACKCCWCGALGDVTDHNYVNGACTWCNKVVENYHTVVYNDSYIYKYDSNSGVKSIDYHISDYRIEYDYFDSIYVPNFRLFIFLKINTTRTVCESVPITINYYDKDNYLISSDSYNVYVPYSQDEIVELHYSVPKKCTKIIVTNE